MIRWWEEGAGTLEEESVLKRVEYMLSHVTFFLFLQDEIEQVILVGGATRVPKVQEVLLKAVGK